MELYASRGYNFAILCSGELYSWGEGAMGRLGNGSNEQCLVPTIVPFFTGKKIEKMYCSMFARHWFIKADGVIYGCGSNEYNELGQHGRENVSTPIVIEWLEDYRNVDLIVGQHCTMVKQ